MRRKAQSAGAVGDDPEHLPSEGLDIEEMSVKNTSSFSFISGRAYVCIELLSAIMFISLLSWMYLL
jgi:hypothetical protein